jgi:hypothetical protein
MTARHPVAGLTAAVLIVTGAMRAGSASAVSARWAPGAVIGVWVGKSAARSDDPEYVRRAMATWTAAGAGRFRLDRATQERTADVRVQFVDGDAHLGEASPLLDPRTGFIVGGDVAIAANVVAGPLEQRAIVYLTSLHELGHVLGLSHSTEFSDVMYLFRQPDDAERYFGAYLRRIRTTKDIGSKAATGLSSHDLEVLDSIYRQ